MSVQYDKRARDAHDKLPGQKNIAQRILIALRAMNLWRRAARPPDVPYGLRKDVGLRNEYQPPDWRELR